MRLSKEKQAFLKQEISSYLKNCQTYLFGSRVDNAAKGGDIDILVIAERSLTLDEKIEIKAHFYKAFGQEKIDIVSYAKTDQSTFKQIILPSSILL
ncbi:MAG: nucleotidyltransferase domain-containing protein [bacterium]|nr:nucleotidyltransferase domain-containing protein [bacterium]